MRKYLVSLKRGPNKFLGSVTQIDIEHVTPKYYMLFDKKDILRSVFLVGLRVKRDVYPEFDTLFEAVEHLIKLYDEAVRASQEYIDNTCKDMDEIRLVIVQKEENADVSKVTS